MSNGKTCRRTVYALLACASLAFNALANAAAGLPRTECIGYYTVAIPDDYAYGLKPENQDLAYSFTVHGVGRRTYFNLGLDDDHPKDQRGRSLLMSREATMLDLQKRLDGDNKEQLAKKKDLRELAEAFAPGTQLARDQDSDGSKHRELVEEAEHVQTIALVPGRQAYLKPAKDNDPPGEETLSILLQSHLLIGEVAPKSTPTETVDAFVRHFKPRALSAIPDDRGFCIPYMLVTGERHPGGSRVNLWLVNQPDIVITLEQNDASVVEPQPPKHFIVNATQPGREFLGTNDTPPRPLDRIPPHIRPVFMDGHPGLGAYAVVKREELIANTANHGEDWSYIGYVPGQAGLKPGESFNLTFKVERFGRFAKHPMTEKQFRELVAKVAGSIKRRAEAWVTP